MSTPLLRRIVIESVVLLPEQDAGELKGKTCFEILAEGEGAYSQHDWLVSSRIRANEGVPASQVAAALQEFDDDPDHFGDVINQAAEAEGFIATQVGEMEGVWMQEDGSDESPRYPTALEALISIYRPDPTVR